jgi:hypothetical protein
LLEILRKKRNEKDFGLMLTYLFYGAVLRGAADVVEVLVHGAHLEDDTLASALIWGASHGHWDVVKVVMSVNTWRGKRKERVIKSALKAARENSHSRTVSILSRRQSLTQQLCCEG